MVENSELLLVPAFADLPDDQHVLAEAGSKLFPVALPPLPVKHLGHNLIDDDIIMHR